MSRRLFHIFQCCAVVCICMVFLAGCISNDDSDCQPTQYVCELTVVVDPLQNPQVEVNPDVKAVDTSSPEINDMTLYLFRGGLPVKTIRIDPTTLVKVNGRLTTEAPIEVSVETPDPLEAVVWCNIGYGSVTVDGTSRGSFIVKSDEEDEKTSVFATAPDLFFGSVRSTVKNSFSSSATPKATLTTARSVSSVVVTAYGLDGNFGSGAYNFKVYPTREGLDFYGNTTGENNVAYLFTGSEFQSRRTGVTSGINYVIPNDKDAQLLIDVIHEDLPVYTAVVDCTEAQVEQLLAPNRTLSVELDFTDYQHTGLKITVTILEWTNSIDQIVNW